MMLDDLQKLERAERKTLRDLERENTPDLETLIAENGYQYRARKGACDEK